LTHIKRIHIPIAPFGRAEETGNIIAHGDTYEVTAADAA
jgi:hypothetical protein